MEELRWWCERETKKRRGDGEGREGKVEKEKSK